MAAAAGGIILVGMVFFLLVLFFTSQPNAYEVYMNGELVGIVEMRSQPELSKDSVALLVVERLERENGEPVRFFDDITVVSTRSSDVTSIDRVVQNISRNANFRVQAALITVDGTQLVILRNVSEARRLLDEIRNDISRKYTDEGHDIIFNDFVETVDVILDFVDAESIMTFTHARSILTTPERIEDIHVVADGDTLSGIGVKYDMSMDSLRAINPGINPDRLTIGQQINILPPKPAVSVRTVVRQIYPERIPFTVQSHPDPNRPSGYSNIINHGVDGLKHVIEHLTYLNGILISRTNVGEEIIEEMKPQLVVQGTGR
jgi:LysM repeat protein